VFRNLGNPGRKATPGQHLGPVNRTVGTTGEAIGKGSPGVDEEGPFRQTRAHFWGHP